MILIKRSILLFLLKKKKRAWCVQLAKKEVNNEKGRTQTGEGQ